MIPPQVAVAIFGGDSAVATEKVLEALMAAVDRLNMEIAAHPLACGLVKRFVADAQRGGARWIAGAAVGDQQGVLAKNRPKNGFDRDGADGWQHSADSGARSVGGHQDANQFVGQPTHCSTVEWNDRSDDDHSGASIRALADRRAAAPT